MTGPSTVTERKTRSLLLSSILIVFVAAILYLTLEFAARSVRIVDAGIAEKISAAADPPQDLPGMTADTGLGYGWDWQPILLPPGEEGAGSAAEFLMLGDSVTRGFGVEEEQGRPYPALLQDLLSEHGPVRVVNASVPGFGLDQMVLKLASKLGSVKPDLVIIAYIPHDLRRTARYFNFGITKPVLLSYTDGSWDMHPAVELIAYYEGYFQARSRFRLGSWWLRSIARNGAYYLPLFYRDEYQLRFEGLRKQLEDLAATYAVRIILVRLANGELSNTVAMVDEWATAVFAAPGPELVRFVDLEPCSRQYATNEGLDFDRDFRRHPGARAHDIFARCLLPHAGEGL